MRVFITGAGGYVGEAIVRAFAAAGHETTGLYHSAESEERVRAAGAEPIRGDVGERGDWLEAAPDHDVVIHAAFDYDAPVETDLAAIDGILSAVGDRIQNRHVIYTSGCWVLGDTGPEPADEDTAIDHPAAVVAWRPSHERQVLQSADETFRTSVVRPGMVYGGRGGLVSRLFETAAGSGAAEHVGDGENRWSLVHRDDLGRLYVKIAEEREGGVFHGVDGAPVRVRDAACAAAEAAGAEGRTRAVPIEEARESLGPLADALVLDQALIGRRSAEIGWAPERASFVVAAESAWREWEEGVRTPA